MKEEILGYDVNIFSPSECVNRIYDLPRADKGTWLACFNTHFYAVALKDKVFERALKDADWLLPDGSGVVLTSRILGGNIKMRVTGSDVFAGLNQRMNAAGSMRVFFWGLRWTLWNKCGKDYPKIIIAGVYSPPFKDVYSGAEISAMLKAVNSVAPDVL